jgi:hypothetical protein
MVCYASPTNNSSVSKEQYVLRQNVKQSGIGKKKICKEFKKTKKGFEIVKVNACASSNLHKYNSSDYNLYFENKIFSYHAIAANFSAMEEIRITRMRI